MEIKAGQIWLNSSHDPVLIVQTLNGRLRVVAFHYRHRNQPTVIDDWTPNIKDLNWQYVGMLTLPKGD